MSREAPPNSAHPKTREERRSWLSQNHQRDEGIWLITYKKATGKPRTDSDDAKDLDHWPVVGFLEIESILFGHPQLSKPIP